MINNAIIVFWQRLLSRQADLIVPNLRGDLVFSSIPHADCIITNTDYGGIATPFAVDITAGRLLPDLFGEYQIISSSWRWLPVILVTASLTINGAISPAKIIGELLPPRC
jgi:hypothetical protein